MEHFSTLYSMLSNNGIINGQNGDGPMSIIHPITFDTMLNNNGLNNKHGLKKTLHVKKALKKHFESRIMSIEVSMKHC